VVVEGRSDGDEVLIEISNPVSATAKAVRSGNRMALDNIRQRLELAFPGRASVDVDDGGELYKVRLRFPVVLEPAAASRGPW
jgi:two-component system sensor histidine kinase AlgZ